MRFSLISLLLFFIGACSQAQALPYYEFSNPSGNYAGKLPKGYVLVIHGGGWNGGQGPGDVAKTQYVVNRYTNRGYATVNTDYRSGGDEGFADVEEVFDKFRASLPASVKMCVYGESAGAHFAQLLAAVRNSGVACTVAAAGPADFTRYGNSQGEQITLSAFQGQFGTGNDIASFWSPVNWASYITKPVLLGSASNDLLVPPVQPLYMDSAMGGKADRVVIDGASSGTTWVHSVVSPTSLRSFYDTERAFIDQAFASTAIRARR